MEDIINIALGVFIAVVVYVIIGDPTDRLANKIADRILSKKGRDENES